MIKLADRKHAKEDSPRARLAALPPERQAQLLDPAEAEFVAHGFDGASLNRILTAAGMSKGQSYYYIDGKADLYRAVIERGLQRLAKAMQGSFQQPATAIEFWQQIAAIFQRLTMELHKDEKLAALARGIYDGQTVQTALAEPLERIRIQADSLIALGQSLGAVRTDLPRTLLSDVLLGAAREIDRWFAAHWSELDKAEAIRLSDKTVDMLAAMASAPPAP